MTYEQAFEWCIEHIPTTKFDSFDKWYDACYDKLNTPNLFENSSFNRMLENYWLGEYGQFDLTEEQQPPAYDTPESRAREISGLPPEQPKEIPVIIPSTGRAPELPRPILVFPTDTPKTEKKGLLDRLKGFFRRKK